MINVYTVDPYEKLTCWVIYEIKHNFEEAVCDLSDYGHSNVVSRPSSFNILNKMNTKWN